MIRVFSDFCKFPGTMTACFIHVKLRVYILFCSNWPKYRSHSLLDYKKTWLNSWAFEHSTSWKCSTSWRFGLYFAYIFIVDRNFLTKFCRSDLSFNRNILTLLYMKFKTSAYVQIAFILYCTSFLTWCEFETYIWVAFWQMKLVNNLINLITCFFLKIVFWSVNCTLLF